MYASCPALICLVMVTCGCVCFCSSWSLVPLLLLPGSHLHFHSPAPPYALSPPPTPPPCPLSSPSPYAAEYFVSGQCSEKTDVYAFGVFLLELVSGKDVFELTIAPEAEDMLLRDWVR